MRLSILLICLQLCASLYAQKECVTANYRDLLIKREPHLADSLEKVNRFIHQSFNSRDKQMGAYGSVSTPRVIIIPVVVHILYHTDEQNISAAQVYSQLEVMNRDFRKLNSDTLRIPRQFKDLAADCFIQFRLASVDPNGNPTTGIVRKKTGIQYFGLDDRIKSSMRGGNDGWDSKQYLNIWVGNLAGGIVGYSSPLGGPAKYDGIVIRTNAFGTTGAVSGALNKGRTTVHETGHWLGLQHIWGDEDCGDDHVADTPPQQMASRGCPSELTSSCNNSGNMYMNYMDFSNDACMYMFTAGQRERMRAAFNPGGPRYSLLSSTAANGTPLTEDEMVPVISTQEKVFFFPNPVSDVLTIDLQNSGSAITSVKIYNQLGQLVKNTTAGKSFIRLNVQDLKNGIYFLMIGETGTPFRFIKQ